MATPNFTVASNILGSSKLNLFLSTFWPLEVRGGSYIFEKFVHPCQGVFLIEKPTIAQTAEKFTVTLEGLKAMFTETILGDVTRRSPKETCRRFGETCFLPCYIIYHDYDSSTSFSNASSYRLAT